MTGEGSVERTRLVRRSVPVLILIKGVAIRWMPISCVEDNWVM